MKKTIETVNFEVRPEVKVHVDELFNDLPRFHDQITSADIYLKRHKEKDEAEYEVQVKVFLPGHEVYAQANGESVNDAAKRVIAKAKRKLRELNESDKEKHQPRPDKGQ
ncbi:MAG: ribosome hibernation-promoting factor, HPF/YfiA family [Tangfeifania sp.]